MKHWWPKYVLSCSQKRDVKESVQIVSNHPITVRLGDAVVRASDSRLEIVG